MRFIYIVIVLFMGCQDTKSVPEKTLLNKTQNPEHLSGSTQQPSEAPFLLNDENVMEFFLDYDKQHKENKVRISTDYGNIDISLFEATKFHRSNLFTWQKSGILTIHNFTELLIILSFKAATVTTKKLWLKEKK